MANITPSDAADVLISVHGTRRVNAASSSVGDLHHTDATIHRQGNSGDALCIAADEK
jgi:hypothetical protein